MIARRTLIGLVSALALWSAPAPAQTGADVVAIVDADAHTMSAAGRVTGATILIRGGRIVALGPDVEVPDGARVIDAAGGPVTPGLISSATHLGLVEVSSAQDTVDRSGSGGRLGAAFDVSRGLNFNSTLIPIARADGLTHGVVIPADSAGAPFAGSGALINVGEGTDLLERASIASFATVTGETTGGAGQSRSAEWIILEQALAAAGALDNRRPRDAGSLEDHLDWLNLLALRPLLSGAMPLVIRAKRESDLRQAAALGARLGIRVIVLDGEQAWRAADLLAARGVAVILDPTANLPVRFDEIGSRLDNAALLHRAGVAIGFYVSGLNMSHNVGQELRLNAGVAVANGLPWEAALEAVTAGAARIWGIADHAGALEPGRAADLVVWSGDPFEVTTWPVAVLVDGAVVSLETRQKRLRERYLPAAAEGQH